MLVDSEVKFRVSTKVSKEGGSLFKVIMTRCFSSTSLPIVNHSSRISFTFSKCYKNESSSAIVVENNGLLR